MWPDQQAPEQQPASSEDGVDVTLIHWMLSMTPAERLATLQRFIESVRRIRARNPEL